MTDRALLQQALDALEWNLPVIEDYGDHEQLNRQHRAITALRSRLAQPEQEPIKESFITHGHLWIGDLYGKEKNT